MAKKKVCASCMAKLTQEIFLLGAHKSTARRNPRPTSALLAREKGVPVNLEKIWAAPKNKQGKKKKVFNLELASILDVSNFDMSASSFLTANSSKADKAIKYGWTDAVLYLAPAMLVQEQIHKLRKRAGGADFAPSAKMNMCKMSTAGCESACLFFSGHGTEFATVQKRFRATILWLSRPDLFRDLLTRAIRYYESDARAAGMNLAVRLNGTSDIIWEREMPEIFERFPNVVFYDYTKMPMSIRGHQKKRSGAVIKRLKWNFAKVPVSMDRKLQARRKDIGLPPNYYLCFSHSDHIQSAANAFQWLKAGYSTIMPVRTAAGKTWATETVGFLGKHPVVDGDVHDLRFFDPPGSIAVLAAKIGNQHHKIIHRRPSADFFFEISPEFGELENWAAAPKSQWYGSARSGPVHDFTATKPYTLLELKNLGVVWVNPDNNVYKGSGASRHVARKAYTRFEAMLKEFGGFDQYREYRSLQKRLHGGPAKSRPVEQYIQVPKDFGEQFAEDIYRETGVKISVKTACLRLARLTFTMSAHFTFSTLNAKSFAKALKEKEAVSRLPLFREMVALERVRGAKPLPPWSSEPLIHTTMSYDLSDAFGFVITKNPLGYKHLLNHAKSKGGKKKSEAATDYLSGSLGF